MTVQKGDKVIATKNMYDITKGKEYTVVDTCLGNSRPFAIRDDVGSNNWQISDEGAFEVAPTGRTFDEDYRTSNPKLHALYVENALETLDALNEAIETFNSHSRVDSSLICGTLRKERAALVKRSAAYFEAAAILYVGKDWLEVA